jgi:hypothetical protein
MRIKKNKLGTYLAVTAGVGCAASVAEGAVTFYGVNSANDTNADPGNGVNPGLEVGSGGFPGSFSANGRWGGARFGDYVTGNPYFSQGADIAINGTGRTVGPYFNAGVFVGGAISGSQNYAAISFDGDDDVYEGVGQFYFDGAGGGYIIAIATTNAVPNPQDLTTVGGPALSISDGKAMIDAAAVPEPSGLALLALGSVGLAAKRRRKAA